MKIDVLCIGHAAYDIVLPVDGFPAENGKLEVTQLFESGGGPAANAAYLLSSWGVGCAFVGTIGDDRYGRYVLDEFQSVGTDLSLFEISGDAPTPVSLILVNRINGSRTIINRKRDHCGCRLKTPAPGLEPKVLLFDGHELQASLDAIVHFPDATTVLDAGSLREGTKVLAGKVDYVVASEHFALQVSEFDSLDSSRNQSEALSTVQKSGCGTTVITLGGRGLIYIAADGPRHLPAFPVRVVDTTAAGDIFHGAFAYGVLKKMSLEDNLRFAAMAAALSVTKHGGRQSAPDVAEVEEALQNA